MKFTNREMLLLLHFAKIYARENIGVQYSQIKSFQSEHVVFI